MRFGIFLAAAVCLSQPVLAQGLTPEEINRIAPTPKVHPERDARIAETMRYGGTDAHPLTLDYYKPAGAGPHPTVVIVHGGGWVGGNSRSGSEAYAADWLAPAGYAVFSINYRLAPGATFADQIADVQRAIRFVRHNAAHYGVDPARIAVLGGSAGGYLSNMVGLLPFTRGAGDAVDQESDQLSAVVTLFIHGDADEAVPYTQSTMLLDALNGIGVKAELVTIPNGKHATGTWTQPNQPDWEAETVRFLDAALHHDGVAGPGIVHGERP